MNVIEQLEHEEAQRLTTARAVPEFRAGDTVRVNVRIREGERERVQAYEGVCIARAGHGVNESFTVRKISFGEGVERVFPLLSPMIESTAAAMTSALITCPGPPPAGVSSRKPRLSLEKFRMSTGWRRHRSCSDEAVPISETPSGPGKASGNMVSTVAVQGMAAGL